MNSSTQLQPRRDREDPRRSRLGTRERAVQDLEVGAALTVALALKLLVLSLSKLLVLSLSSYYQGGQYVNGGAAGRLQEQSASVQSTEGAAGSPC